MNTVKLGAFVLAFDLLTVSLLSVIGINIDAFVRVFAYVSAGFLVGFVGAVIVIMGREK